jgi:replication factor C subunit 3/5
VRVAAPTEDEICDVLARSGKKEGWPLAKELNMRIAKESGRNLRRALLMYEAVHAQKYEAPYLLIVRTLIHLFL